MCKRHSKIAVHRQATKLGCGVGEIVGCVPMYHNKKRKTSKNCKKLTFLLFSFKSCRNLRQFLVSKNFKKIFFYILNQTVYVSFSTKLKTIKINLVSVMALLWELHHKQKPSYPNSFHQPMYHFDLPTTMHNHLQA